MRVSRGFTLIEVLVVILIISIITGMSIMAFGDFGAGRKAYVFSEQFTAYIKLVRQRAILEMSTLGISVNNKGYGTWKYEGDNIWKPLPQKSLFRWQNFPDNIVVTLANKSKSSATAPEIIILPTGEMTAFKINFGTSSVPNQSVLTGHTNGEISLKMVSK